MSGELLRNIVSFGAAGRVENQLSIYKQIEAELTEAHELMERQRAATNLVLQGVVDSKLSAVARLGKLKKISKRIGAKQRNFSEGLIGGGELRTPLENLEQTLKSADIAKNVAKGTTAGISTALGTWALVGAFGTASTGTAIAGLSGAAATNATLAWLGGGAVAAGGGGMAAGAAVLGGLVVVPALLLTGLFSHIRANKQIGELKEACTKATKAVAESKRATLSMNALERRGIELSGSIDRAGQAFQQQFHQVIKELYPWGFLSRAKRHLRALWRKPFFSEDDLRVLAPLLQMASSVAQLIDTKLMDETGTLL